MPDLFDLLACPDCRSDLERAGRGLVCSACARDFPIVGRVPILLPAGDRPAPANEHELHVRNGYDPWLHREVLESLPPGGVALEIGAGSMALSVPNVIRLDVGLTPYVDVVGDSHALPFRDASLDFVFSLAVVEHLERPHDAASEMHRVLKDGGLVYGECSFVFPYHGYPHHYFNATHQGLARVFGSFTPLRRGVAPYQMPSFAVRGVLEAWANDLAGVPDAADARELVRRLLAEPLGALDARLAPHAVLRCAAGTYFLGVKHSDRATLPDVLRPERAEGRGLASALDGNGNATAAAAFRKHGDDDDRTAALLGLGPGTVQTAPDAGMEGWLDGVVGGDAHGALQIGGWAADPTRGAPVAGVEVWVDDATCIAATIGGERADVVAVSGRNDYRLSGWTALLPLRGLAPGRHHVAAFAYGVHGSRAKLSGERTIDVPPRG